MIKVRAGLYEETYVINPHTTVTYIVEKVEDTEAPSFRKGEWTVQTTINEAGHLPENLGYFEDSFPTKGHAQAAINEMQNNGKYIYNPQFGWSYVVEAAR